MGLPRIVCFFMLIEDLSLHHHNMGYDREKERKGGRSSLIVIILPFDRELSKCVPPMTREWARLQRMKLLVFSSFYQEFFEWKEDRELCTRSAYDIGNSKRQPSFMRMDRGRGEKNREKDNFPSPLFPSLFPPTVSLSSMPAISATVS